MPETINFPVRLDDDNSLFLVSNNLRTQLSSSVTDAETTIPVISTAGYPDVGYLTILTGADITDAEAIAYSGTDGTNFLNAERGADGTAALEHLPADNVDHTVVARHHNNIKDAVIELERYLGVSGSENFVPFVNGNVILPGALSVENTLTVSGGSTFAFVTVTGTLTGEGDFDFKADGAISGTLTVGEIPGTSMPDTKYILDESTVNITSTSYVDLGVETGPLAAGKNLLLYSATGGSTTNVSLNVKCSFGGTDIGEARENCQISSGPWGSSNCNGFKIVTGNDSNTAKFEGDLGSSLNADISSMSMLAIPLEDMSLVSGTDYWYDNGNDTATSVAGGPATITTMPATLPVGDYIVFAEVEAAHSTPLANGVYQINFRMDGADLTNNLSGGTIGGAGATLYRPYTLVRKITITTEQEYIFTVVGQEWYTGNCNFRRGRFCIIKASNFDQVVGRSSTWSNQSTTNDTFVKRTDSELSYTPNQKESIIVIANPLGSLPDLTGLPAHTFKLVNETDGIAYMTDTNSARHMNTTSTIPTLMFAKIDDVVAPKTFSVSFRDPENTGSTITNRGSSMVIWGLGLPISDAIQYTAINGSQVRTANIETNDLTIVNSGTITADNVVATLSLTVSGVPVVTGTSTIPDPLTLGVIAANTSLTVSGTPVVIGTHGDLVGLGDDDHPQYGQLADAETVVGKWDFSGGMTVSGETVATGTHGDLVGLGDDDHPQYGQLADNESVAGTWDFTNGVTVSGFPVSTGTGGGAAVLNPTTFAGNGSIAADETLALATANGIILTLPDATAITVGQIYVVKDQSGAAGSDTIVVTGTSSQTIDDELKFSINTDFQSVTLVSDGSNWSVI